MLCVTTLIILDNQLNQQNIYRTLKKKNQSKNKINKWVKNYKNKQCLPK